MAIAIGNEALREQENQRAMVFLSKATPWTISILLHVAVLLVLLFTVFITIKDVPTEKLEIQTAYLVESPAMMTTQQATAVSAHSPAQQNRPTMPKPPVSTAITKMPIIVAASGPAAVNSTENFTSIGAFDMRTASTGDKGIFGDKAGNAGRADNIVYVIDASGSMMLSSAAQTVREELYRALGRLSTKQSFGIIFFTGGRTLTFSKKLQPANQRNIYKAVDFTETVQSTGPSDTQDALTQAFRMLQSVPKKRNLICLLSDGELKDSAKVQAMLRELNHAGRVHINTILTGSKESAAIQSMKNIAASNGGSFKYVELAD